MTYAGDRRLRCRQSCDGTTGSARSVRRQLDRRGPASAGARRSRCAGRTRRRRGGNSAGRGSGHSRPRAGRTPEIEGLGRRGGIRLDRAALQFAKTEPPLGDLTKLPSEYVHDPHPEGTKDPIGRFEATMGGVDDDTLDRLYSSNFAALHRGIVPV